MSDWIIATAGDWAVASDGRQWILMRRRMRHVGPYWHPMSSVRSTKDILARCMREEGAGEATAQILLAGLPDTFDEWKTKQSRPAETLGPVPEGTPHG